MSQQRPTVYCLGRPKLFRKLPHPFANQSRHSEITGITSHEDVVFPSVAHSSDVETTHPMQKDLMQQAECREKQKVELNPRQSERSLC